MLFRSGVDPSAFTPELVAQKLRLFVDTAIQVRGRICPGLKDTAGLSDEEFRAALPNYCPIR